VASNKPAPTAVQKRGVDAIPVPEERLTIAHRFNGGYPGIGEESPVGTTEIVCRHWHHYAEVGRPCGT